MNQEYIDRLRKIETELRRWLPESADTEQFTKLEKVFPGLGKYAHNIPVSCIFEPLTDMLSRGGKRWRPLLMTLVCETLGGGEAALPLTPLVEFSHNASLIHDDIEDDSDERRGKQAIHHLYGTDTAINSGSFFYFLSLCCINSYYGDNASCSASRSFNASREQIYKLWGDHMRKLHLGQAMDISWHRDITFVPKIDDYYTMCGMKTGCLASLAAELGAFIAGAVDSAKKYAEAAMKLGVGFQILDDVKNLTDNIPGKKHGDDVVEGKKSLPVLLYLHRYPERRERIYFCFHEAKENGCHAPEVQEFIDILTGAGVLKEAEEKAKILIQEARDSFNTPLINGLVDLIS